MGYQAKKRFGQNFLVDRSVIDSILVALGASEEDLVLEIGPGLGALTGPLAALALAHPLHVVELDRDLAQRLRTTYGARIVVHQGDALTFDFSAVVPAGKKLRVIGNLPYNISSPLLFHLLEHVQSITDQHFMLQKEVVDRMVASPGTKDFGRLSVMLQVRYHMELLFEVPPSAFEPAPKVDSAIVRMIPRPPGELEATDASLFSRVVMQAFSQRRKMLRNTLAQFDQVVPMESLGITPTARAEDIAPATYVAYANALSLAKQG